MRDHFERLIERLAATCGASLEKMNDGQDISVVFGDFFVLFSYLADAEQMLLTTCVAELPKTGREAVLLTLLEGQYFFRETVGATLAVDNEARFITLQLARHLTLLSAENFPIFVENYLNVANAWRERLQSEEKSEESPQQSHAHPQEDATLDPVALMTMLRV